MPPVIAVVVTIAATYGWAAAIVAVVTLASVAYSAYMMASMEKPSEQPDANKRLQTVRSSIQPHRVIYGECMTGGVLVYAQSHSIDPYTLETVAGDNTFISLVVAFCAHEVDEIKEIWLNDKISSDVAFVRHIKAARAEGYWIYSTDDTLPDVWVETRPAVPAHNESWITVTKYTGTLTQTADPLLLLLPPVPTTIVTKYPSTGLNNLTASGDYAIAGMSVFAITIASTGATDTFNWHDDHGHSGSGVPMTAANQLLANGISIKFATKTGHSMGQSWEVRAFDGAPWTADCTLTNRAYVVVTLRKNDTVFPTGLPNIKALIRGNNKIYDPATTLTGYSDNWALCVRDYLTKPYGLNAPAGDINNTVAIAARNLCEELITLANGSTQKRYTVNGSFTVDKTPVAIMSELLASAYGAITWTQGQYRILPAVYYAPDMTFHGMNAAVPGLTESDLRGPITIRPLPSMKDKFNTVKGTYISPETWQPVDFPTVTNALYVSEDGGELVKDIQLSYVTDPARAQRIAKIVLEKGRQCIAVDFPAKWSAFPLAVGDNVPISIAHLGWVQKIFTVRDWRMNSEGGVDLTLQEDAIGCYAWNNGEETTIDLAQNTILPDALYVPVPTGITVGEELYATNVGSIVQSRAIITWDDMGSSQYGINYLPPNNSIWAPLPLTQDTTSLIDDVIPGTYTIRVRGMNALGIWGEWAEHTVTLLGKTAPPPDVDSFLVSPQQDGTRDFKWTLASPPLDLAGYKIRFKRGTSALWSDMAPLHTGLLVVSPYESNQLVAGDYVFAIKAVDTTGNESLNPLYILATLPDQRLANVWTSSVATDGLWPGTKTDCYITSEGILEATDAATWDDLPATWAETAQWNSNPAGTISYETPPLDMGAPIAFTPQVSAYGTGSITIEMATSADNSSWSAWAAPDKSDIQYVKFRFTVTATAPEIAALTLVTAYLVVRPVMEEINDLDTSTLTGSYRIGTGDVRLPMANSYDILKQVSLTLQNVGAGWSWELIDKDLTLGPRIKIYNNSNTLADAVIDAYIKGI